MILTSFPVHNTFISNLGRLLGPPLDLTQPLETYAHASVAPRLALVDDFKAVPALKRQALEFGSDLLLTSRLMASFRTPAEVAMEHFRLARCRTQIEKAGPAVVLNYGLGGEVEDWARAQLSSAQVFMENGAYEKAYTAAKKAEMVWGYKKEPGKLLAVYRFLSLLLERLGRHDLGLIHWDRCIALAQSEEVNDPASEAEGLEGKYRCLIQRGYLEDALAAAEKAEDIYGSRNDMPALARIYRSLARCSTVMRHYERAGALLSLTLSLSLSCLK